MPFDATQSGTGQNQDYIAPYAALPGAGWGPSKIVTGFLAASASYFNTQDVVRAYLTSAADRTWNPKGSVTVFSNSASVSPPDPVTPKNADLATVTVTGPVQATLNTNGQVLSVAEGQAQPSVHGACGTAAGSSAGTACEDFTLVKSDGQWRIAKLPTNLLFNASDFVRVYQSQDVYFFSQTSSNLVPDTVFAPLGTSVTTLLKTLVDTLITGPTPTWLGGATVSKLPTTTTVKGISLSGNTAVVNLGGGIVTASLNELNEVAAQLAWTLVGPSGEQYNIDAVQLEINGTKIQLNGTGPQTPMPTYREYDPYPQTQATFSYVDSTGAAQSRCGSVTDNTVAVAVPVFGHANGPELTSCGGSAPAATAQPTTTAKPGNSVAARTANPLSMVAVSPNGTYVATVSAGHNEVSIWQVGSKGKAVNTWTGTGITSISWDRQPNLWITTSTGIWVLPAAGKPIAVPFDGDVSALSIAPDGARVAVIVDGELQLAAIVPGHSTGKAGLVVENFTLGIPVPLGPRITDAVALTWYDQDDLMVISTSLDLQEVPVNGRAASQQPTSPVPPAGVYADSIAASGAGNYLVVGLSNGQLEVSTGINGTWQVINALGAEPAYSIP
jgi:hypothetical protein